MEDYIVKRSGQSNLIGLERKVRLWSHNHLLDHMRQLSSLKNDMTRDIMRL